MKQKKAVVLALLLSCISFLVITCKHEIPVSGDTGNGSDGSTQTSNCSADTIYFVNDILPLMNSNCATSGCHDAISHKEGVQLNSYSTIRNYVTPLNAANSTLYKEVIKTGSERMPPPPMSPLTTAQIEKLKKWINQGALNNQCTGACDTTLFTYSAAVSVTINTWCKGCHNPASLGGGIDLSTYAAVRTQALNGKLMGSINHATGYIPMPQGSNKLPDCQIKQIQKWIQAGSLNN